MTPEVGKRAPFELLAFTAAPAACELVVVELAGRFVGQDGRFTRQPVLVVESDDGRPRLELAPTRATREDGRWSGVYAIPAEAMPGARLALGVRGTLLSFPAPDERDDGERLSVLAREANTLRRALEDAEAEAASARAEANATGAEARRTADEQMAAVREQVDAARAETIAEHEQARAELTARAEAAEQRATEAEARAEAAEAGTEVLRAELAEEREERDRLRTAPTEDPGPTTAVRRPTTHSVRHLPTVDPPAPASTRTSSPRGPGAWIAVAALVLFAFVLLGLLAGFLA